MARAISAAPTRRAKRPRSRPSGPRRTSVGTPATPNRPVSEFERSSSVVTSTLTITKSAAARTTAGSRNVVRSISRQGRHHAASKSMRTGRPRASASSENGSQAMGLSVSAPRSPASANATRAIPAARRGQPHGEAHEEGAQVAFAEAAEALHDRRRNAQLIEAEVAAREADEHERDRGQDRGALERRAEERAGERRRHAEDREGEADAEHVEERAPNGLRPLGPGPAAEEGDRHRDERVDARR